MKSLNWKKGLVRLWVFTTVIWVIPILVILTVMQIEIHFYESANTWTLDTTQETFLLKEADAILNRKKTDRNEIAFLHYFDRFMV